MNRHPCFASALLQNLAKHLSFVSPIVELHIKNSIRYYRNRHYFCKDTKNIHTNKQYGIKTFICVHFLPFLDPKGAGSVVVYS